MANKKIEIKEGLATDISSQLLYCFFVDLFPISTRKGGLMTIMFPNVSVKKMSRWFGNITETETYTQNLDLIKSISQKFGANSTLKSLYRVVNSLKTKETEPDNNDARISDIALVMSKIQRIIKSKLTPEEQKLFAKLAGELKEAATNASKSIEGSVGASTTKAEKPVETPEEEPEETPEEEPEETPEEEPEPEPEPEPASEPKPEEKPTTPPTPAPKTAPTPKTAPAPKTAPSPNPAGGGEEEKEKEPKKEEGITKEEFEQKLKAIIKEIVREKLGL